MNALEDPLYRSPHYTCEAQHAAEQKSRAQVPIYRSLAFSYTESNPSTLFLLLFFFLFSTFIRGRIVSPIVYVLLSGKRIPIAFDHCDFEGFLS